MRRKPTQDEIAIKCKRLISGEIAYGNLIETDKEVHNGNQ